MLRTDEVCREIEQTLTNGLNDIGILCASYAKEECPVDTGILRASIDSVIYEEDGKVVIYANTDYAEKVHEGHGAYSGVPYLENAVMMHLPEIRQLIARGE